MVVAVAVAVGDDVGKVEDPVDAGKVVGNIVDLDIDVGGKVRGGTCEV